MFDGPKESVDELGLSKYEVVPVDLTYLRAEICFSLISKSNFHTFVLSISVAGLT